MEDTMEKEENGQARQGESQQRKRSWEDAIIDLFKMLLQLNSKRYGKKGEILK
jgi:hypothetical protein